MKASEEKTGHVIPGQGQESRVYGMDIGRFFWLYFVRQILARPRF